VGFIKAVTAFLALNVGFSGFKTVISQNADVIAGVVLLVVKL